MVLRLVGQLEADKPRLDPRLGELGQAVAPPLLQNVVVELGLSGLRYYGTEGAPFRMLTGDPGGTRGEEGGREVAQDRVGDARFTDAPDNLVLGCAPAGFSRRVKPLLMGELEVPGGPMLFQAEGLFHWGQNRVNCYMVVNSETRA